MATENIVKPINSQNLGNTLDFLLTSKSPYKDYTFIDLKNSDNKTKQLIRSYIIEVFTKYLSIPFELNALTSVSTMQPGDVLFIENRYYLITSYQNDNYITWPRCSKEDIDYINNGINIKEYKVVRPDFSKVKSTILKSIDNISNEAILSDPKLKELFSSDYQTFNNQIKIEEYGDGVLQIGDLIFTVDPTQIAFNTQNGYQYFPTVRTQGNPKIPTMQQVKNISITLIFPNTDTMLVSFKILSSVSFIVLIFS